MIGVYGTEGSTNVIALRFQAQIAENSKKIAFFNSLPELNHNEKINLIIKEDDYIKNTLKIIHIISKNGIYYLYLRDFDNIIIDNLDCTLFF